MYPLEDVSWSTSQICCFPMLMEPCDTYFPQAPWFENHLEDLWWKSKFKTMMCITRCAYMVQSAIFELYWTTISSKVINKIRKEKLFVCVTPVAPSLELYFIKIIFKIDNEVPRVDYVVARYFWVVGCILCHILYIIYRYWNTTHHQGALSFLLSHGGIKVRIYFLAELKRSTRLIKVIMKRLSLTKCIRLSGDQCCCLLMAFPSYRLSLIGLEHPPVIDWTCSWHTHTLVFL